MPRLQESSISLTFSPQSGVNQFQNLSPLSEIDVAFRFRVTFLPPETWVGVENNGNQKNRK